MYLKHLTINGFKSFAKKSDLEFSAPITAIVGPNGSGKSNVAESFRFVLGEQSPTKMRGKKGEDLIWGGSDQVSRGNRASAAITLDNRKRVFGLDFDEIVLERAVHRDGVNEYLINGSQVRLKDVQEMMAAANIGPSGHHIISQGEADRILSASPKERRAMIEDALGLKVYQYKKNEAEKKLEKTKENIEKVESLRREVAPHLRFLEKQVKKLERAVETKERLTSAYAEYLKREDLYLAVWQDKLKASAAPQKKVLAEIEDALTKARSVLESKKHDERRAALVKAEHRLSEVRQARQVILREIGVLEGQMSFLQKRVRESKDRASLSHNPHIEYVALDKVIAALEREVEKTLDTSDVTLLRRKLTDFVRTLRQFLSQTKNDGRGSDAGEIEELRQLQAEKDRIDNTLKRASKDEEEAETEYQKIRADIEQDQGQSREAERAVFTLINERRECEASLAKLQFEESAIERDREEFKHELREAVALLGRGATDYLNYQLEEGDAAVAAEDREKQRERHRQLEKMKVRLEELGGTNSDLETEYKNVKERDDFLLREIGDLNQSVAKLEQLIDELEEQLDQRFGDGIVKIASEFNRFFSLMFGGGSAGLERVKLQKRSRLSDIEEDGSEEEGAAPPEPEAKTETGIEIEVKLPNKRVKGLDMLSGGERALTSIALIFAMSQVNPPLFVILDETDAALDEANSRRYGDMIEALAKKSQLILITHNRETMSRAGILYGVTMASDGASKLLSVKLSDALAAAK
jgi:chromosome segregation ATPase